MAEALLKNQRFMARVDVVHGAQQPGTAGMIDPNCLDVKSIGAMWDFMGYFMDLPWWLDHSLWSTFTENHGPSAFLLRKSAQFDGN